MKKIIYIIIPVAICLLVGFLASLLQANALTNWYPYLNKSPLTPPNSVFPIVWTILYIMMGISIGLIAYEDRLDKLSFVKLFALQLTLNFLWSITFFTFRSPGMGLLIIIVLELLLLYYAWKAYAHGYRPSAYLFIPYIVWVGFATYLTLYVVMYN